MLSLPLISFSPKGSGTVEFCVSLCPFSDTCFSTKESPPGIYEWLPNFFYSRWFKKSRLTMFAEAVSLKYTSLFIILEMHQYYISGPYQ